MARTTNRVYFQHSVKDCDRGKVLSIIMMDRGMIPLGSLIMSFFADMFGILTTFTIMGISTISISLIFISYNVFRIWRKAIMNHKEWLLADKTSNIERLTQ